jgi:hypothetical protein
VWRWPIDLAARTLVWHILKRRSEASNKRADERA